MESFFARPVNRFAILSTGVSEIYGSRRRLPSLPSFLIESLGQLFGFLIGGVTGFRSGEFIIQLLAFFIPCWNQILAAPPRDARMVFFAADRIPEHRALTYGGDDEYTYSYIDDWMHPSGREQGRTKKL